MANHVLFWSSVGMTILHAWCMLAWGAWTTDPYLVFVYAIGLLTSLLNHGLTSEWCKWGDRLWMAYGCATDLEYILRIHRGSERHWLIGFQASYIGAFFLAKWLVARAHKHAGNAPHLVTHAGATLLHAWLLYRVTHPEKV